MLCVKSVTKKSGKEERSTKMIKDLEELVFAKCIKNIDPATDKKLDLEVGQYYIVKNISIGQSFSYVTIGDTSYNSILFEYFDKFMFPLDIYDKYSPYKNFRRNKNEWEWRQSISNKRRSIKNS